MGAGGGGGGRGRSRSGLEVTFPKRLPPGVTAAVLLGLAATPRGEDPPAPPSARVIAVEPPASGATVGSGLGFVAGRATSEVARLLDVVLVIDTSDSTEMPSGADIDGDGVVGAERTTRPVSSDEGDTVLAAEVAASRA